jgi:hypothetical protein
MSELTELQIACLIRVLGKPDIDNSIRFDELEMLLENFGVKKKSTSI